MDRGALAHPSDYRLQELVRLFGQRRKREDRGTALTVASLRQSVDRSGKRHQTIFDVGADTSAVGGRTDKIICWSLLEKCSNIWNRSASRREYESPGAETTHRQSERSSRRLSCPNGS